MPPTLLTGVLLLTAGAPALKERVASEPTLVGAWWATTRTWPTQRRAHLQAQRSVLVSGCNR